MFDMTESRLTHTHFYFSFLFGKGLCLMFQTVLIFHHKFHTELLVVTLPVFFFSSTSWSVRSSTSASKLFAYFSIIAIILSKMLGFLEANMVIFKMALRGILSLVQISQINGGKCMFVCGLYLCI